MSLRHNRKEAEGTLGKGEVSFRSLLQHVLDVVAILDADGTVSYASPAVEAMLGYAPEEVIDTGVFDYVHPDDVERAVGALAETLVTPGVLPAVEVRACRADGTWRHVEVVRNNRLDDPGVGGVVITVRDVTERKEAEERYRGLMENAQDFVVLADENNVALYASPAVERVLGYTSEEFVGTVIAGYVHPDDLERTLGKVVETLPVPGPHHMGTIKYRRKDGSDVYLEVVVNNRLDDPVLRGVVCNCRDVTERVKAEERLREAEERYRVLVERVPAVIYVQQATASGAVTYVSPRMKDLLGYEPEECTSNPGHWLGIIHPEDLERVLAEDGRVNETGEPFSMEYRQFAKDGRVVWIKDEATLRRDEDGEPLYWLGVQTDVTGRKEAEETLKESEERYRNQTRELALLHRVRTALARELDLRSVLHGVVEAIAETYGYTQVSAYLLEGEELVLQHQVGYERVIERIPIMEGVSGRAVRTGRPILVDEVRADRDFLGAVENLTSEICVPLLDGGEVLGFLNVESRDGVKLTHKDLELMVTLGDHVGVAVGRARLHTQVRRNEERLRSLADAAFEGILISDAGEILEANRALSDMFGYATAELVGRSALEFVAPEHRDLVRGQIASGTEEPYEIVGVRKDGTRLDLEVRGRAYSYRGRSVRVTAVRDVTERKRAEDRLRETEERYRTLVERIPAVTFVDQVGSSEESSYVSPQIEAMLGYAPEEWVAGRLWRERLHPDDRERVLASDKRFEADGEPVDQEYRLLAKDGSVVWVREETVLMRDEAGEPRFVQGIMSNVTQKKRSEERLHHLAFHDPLTGLPNRRLFVDHLGHALKLTRRQGNRVAVLFMDLDQFKVVNDSLGHNMGDLLLMVVAQRLGRCLRPEDTLARFGGDEFVVLLEVVDDPAEAVRVAERITQELRRPFVLEERQLYATASIGVSVGHARTHSPEGLLREADTAMYRAKAEGSGYEVFDPAMHDRAVTRLELENDLRRAIEEDEFVVHYQPLVNLQTGELWGMEALVRWEHPERGLLGPDEFVPVAEESGLVVPMGELVLEEACRRAVQWQEEFPLTPPLAMSVNLSGRQLRRPDLHEVIGRALAETGLPASSLGLDITETVYIGALEANTAALDRLRASGIRVSLDDFGSGYSSLSYLKRLPTNILKIDRSFTKGLGLEVEDTAIVQTVVDLAHILGMEVVAEGVEIEEQETLLREMGCDFGQGFYFSKPLPPEAASGFLRSAFRDLSQRGGSDSLSDND